VRDAEGFARIAEAAKKGLEAAGKPAPAPAEA